MGNMYVVHRQAECQLFLIIGTLKNTFLESVIQREGDLKWQISMYYREAEDPEKLQH